MRYINQAYAAGSDFVTVWRYGVTPDDIFKTLRDIPAKQPPVAAPALMSGAAYRQSARLAAALDP